LYKPLSVNFDLTLGSYKVEAYKWGEWTNESTLFFYSRMNLLSFKKSIAEKVFSFVLSNSLVEKTFLQINK